MAAQNDGSRALSGVRLQNQARRIAVERIWSGVTSSSTDVDSELNPNSTAGQVASVGAFATGLTHLTGWRRQVARWVIILLLCAPGFVIIATHI